ncbi:MAG: DNA-binding protein [Nitrosospira sp.]|nr:DNA-binding protein [Nitrosospira sp.]
MKTVTLSVSTEKAVRDRLSRAFQGEKQSELITFASVDLLWKVLGTKRREILQAMVGQGELTFREVARLVDRDVKAVHGDVTALVDAGVVERTNHGVVFPYDVVHVDFTMEKAA